MTGPNDRRNPQDWPRDGPIRWGGVAGNLTSFILCTAAVLAQFVLIIPLLALPGGDGASGLVRALVALLWGAATLWAAWCWIHVQVRAVIAPVVTRRSHLAGRGDPGLTRDGIIRAMKTHTPTLRFVVPLALLLLVAACGGSAASSPSGSAPSTLAGTNWTVRTVDGAAAVPGKEPTAAFADTTVAGSGGCNTYRGDYTYDGADGDGHDRRPRVHDDGVRRSRGDLRERVLRGVPGADDRDARRRRADPDERRPHDRPGQGRGTRRGTDHAGRYVLAGPVGRQPVRRSSARSPRSRSMRPT